MENKRKTAIIAGGTGQDGAYLANLLLQKGYMVIATYRRNSSVNFWRLGELGILNHENLTLAEFDITDLGCCIRIIEKYSPVEFYNLAAQSFVGVSFDQPHTTAEVTGLGVLNVLEAIRAVDRSVKFYQASTSEMFGQVLESPQRETTPFHPRSPYGVAKLFGHWATINYRESYDIFAVSGILFNHESPLRGREFVTRKITDGVAKIKLGLLECLELGNLGAERDWGFAAEYVEGMWKMLQVDYPDTYVLATGRKSTVREFAKLAFQSVGMTIEFSGEGAQEVGLNTSNGKTVLRVNPRHYRPAEVDTLLGDPSKAQSLLGWKSLTTLEDLCAIMVENDIRRNQTGFSF